MCTQTVIVFEMCTDRIKSGVARGDCEKAKESGEDCKRPTVKYRHIKDRQCDDCESKGRPKA